MATAARELIEENTVRVQDLEVTPVIIDGGSEVRIVLVRLPGSPAVGDRFTLGATEYEIVRTQDHARGCVARPVAEPTS